MSALGLLNLLLWASGILLWAVLFCVFVAWQQIKPWDTSNQDHSATAAMLPYYVHALFCWGRYVGAWLVNNIPGPLLAVDMATLFLKSQVLFAVVNLGIPDALLAGPMTASQIAKACSCKQVEWLDRLLKAAAVLGIVSKRKARQPTAMTVAATANGVVTCNGVARTQFASAAGWDMFTKANEYEYYSNQLTTCLTHNHKSSVAAMVKLWEYNYTSATSLSKSVQTGETSHRLQTGLDFWEHLAQDPVKGAVFDQAMHNVKDLGGSAVLSHYCWNKYNVLIDIAGGNGSFVSALLEKNEMAHGIVMDQKKQVERALDWWRSRHPKLLPRVTFKAGNMLDAATVPAPPAGCGKVAYILRNILHNWPDAEALKILRAIRGAIPAADTPRVKLTIIELTTSTARNLPTLEPKLMIDILMLSLFGSGKERSEAQFEALLAAAGFQLVRMVPTVGLMLVLEAVPV